MLELMRSLRRFSHYDPYDRNHLDDCRKYNLCVCKTM